MWPQTFSLDPPMHGMLVYCWKERHRTSHGSYLHGRHQTTASTTIMTLTLILTTTMTLTLPVYDDYGLELDFDDDYDLDLDFDNYDLARL